MWHFSSMDRLASILCVFICVYMFLCAGVHAYVCMEMRDWCLLYWDNISHYTWYSLIRLDLLATVPQGPSCLCLAAAGVLAWQACTFVPTFFAWVLGMRTQVLIIAWQTLYTWAISPAPKGVYFKLIKPVEGLGSSLAAQNPFRSSKGPRFSSRHPHWVAHSQF